MTNPEQETRKAVAECTVTKVHGQPTNRDIDRLEDELTAIASSFHSELGGGLHGHAGLIKSDADYDLIAPGTPFVFPSNPGVYPAGAMTTAQRPQREAEHKALIVQFQTCIGASKGLKDLILKSVEEDYLLELRSVGIGYLNVTPLQMLTHLRNRWGTMDYVDITALLAECDTPWNAAEVPEKYFNRLDEARRQLARLNVQIDERAIVAKALKSFKDAGDYDAAIPRATGHASINNIVEEMATTTGELVATLTDSHAKQVETLMKSTTAALEKLTAAILANNSNKPIGGDAKAKAAAKAAAWAEKKKNATTCPHCNLIHPNRTHSQCWELPDNASKRPTGWKSVKST